MCGRIVDPNLRNKERADWLDQQISKAVLGQTATTDAVVGGLGSGKEHRAVQKDIETADAKALAAILNRDLLRPWMQLNFGPLKRYPRLKIEQPEQEDLKALAEAIVPLIDRGLEVEQATIMGKFGLPEPKPGAKLLRPQSGASLAPVESPPPAPLNGQSAVFERSVAPAGITAALQADGASTAIRVVRDRVALDARIEAKDAIFSGDFADARTYFDAMSAEGDRAVTAQDRTVYALCRPERLLDLIRRFTVFDGGVRKVARHQQFFGIRRAVETVKQHDVSGARKGGVIWHTQGSGKSLTMVMLGRSLALERTIENPRILIVTDRDDLDKQIKDTFKSCDLEPVRATSGAHLLELVHNKAPLVTTIINKFDTALKNSKLTDEDPNIFVLVDESHRTQTAARQSG